MNLFDQTYEQVIAVLKKNLPSYLTYHNCNHTKLVLEKTIFIAEKEHISEKDLLLLKFAALYHDTGYQKSNEDHETESCKIAEKELTKLKFKESDIEQICGMIMATKIPQQPNTHLECILADADLEYLGTNDYEKISKLLYVEMKHFRSDLDLKKWYEIQIDFISKHKFHTAFCQQYRETYKLENLMKIKEKARLLF